MQTQQEQYISHETRIRVMEKLSESIVSRLDRLDEKMDNQFKWIIGTIITMVGGLILTKII